MCIGKNGVREIINKIFIEILKIILRVLLIRKNIWRNIYRMFRLCFWKNLKKYL